MSPSSSRPAKRPIITVAVGLLAAATLASCGDNESLSSQFNPSAGAAPPAVTTTQPPASPKPPTSAKPPAGAKPQPSPKPPARASGVRLGCRTYCQAAGIFNGGPGESGQPAVTIVSSGAVTADGYLPVVLTCNLTVQCQGSLVLDFQRPGFPEQAYIASKSDVVVDAGATTTLEVPLDDVTLSWLQSHGSTKFQAILDAGPSFGCNGYGSDKSLGLPDCGAEPIDGFDVFSIDDLTVAPPG